MFVLKFLHSLTILYNTQPYRILKLNIFKMHINMNQATDENMITYHIKHKFGSYWLESRSINQQTNEINKKKTQLFTQSQCFFCSICTKGREKKYTDFNHSEIKIDKYRKMVWKSNMSDNLIFTKFRMIIYNMMNKLWHNRWICNIPINSCCRDNSHRFTFWNFILEDFHSFQLTFPIFCEQTTKKIY